MPADRSRIPASVCEQSSPTGLTPTSSPAAPGRGVAGTCTDCARPAPDGPPSPARAAPRRWITSSAVPAITLATWTSPLCAAGSLPCAVKSATNGPACRYLCGAPPAGIVGTTQLTSPTSVDPIIGALLASSGTIRSHSGVLCPSPPRRARRYAASDVLVRQGRLECRRRRAVRHRRTAVDRCAWEVGCRSPSPAACCPAGWCTVLTTCDLKDRVSVISAAPSGDLAHPRDQPRQFWQVAGADQVAHRGARLHHVRRDTAGVEQRVVDACVRTAYARACSSRRHSSAPPHPERCAQDAASAAACAARPWKVKSIRVLASDTGFVKRQRNDGRVPGDRHVDIAGTRRPAP